jgi:hypothetical protein
VQSFTTPNKRGNVELGIRGERVHPGAHIAYFWENEQDFREGLRFLEVGVRNGDACVVFGHQEANERVLTLLRSTPVDVEFLRSTGRLAVLGGHTAGDAMLGEIGATFQKMIDGGAKLIRLLGNIGWNKQGWPGEDDILAFESKVTGAARAFPCVVVCMYDVHSLSGRVMVHGALATHPITVCGNVMRHNPYFVEHEEFLQRLRVQ